MSPEIAPLAEEHGDEEEVVQASLNGKDIIRTMVSMVAMAGTAATVDTKLWRRLRWLLRVIQILR